MTSIYRDWVLAAEAGQKKIALLIDPDKLRLRNLERFLRNAVDTGVDYFLVGGSLVVHDMLDRCLTMIKTETDIPAVLFPGETYQVNPKADALLFLSLVSGRNPDLLIGRHVQAAPYIKRSGLEIIPTAYMLVNGGNQTTVAYISQTQPIPAEKPEIASCTAMAAEMLGMRCIYLDAGSGARQPVSADMIREVSESVDVPVIVGGGIRTPEMVRERLEAGAGMVVVGHAAENDPSVIPELVAAAHSCSGIKQNIRS